MVPGPHETESAFGLYSCSARGEPATVSAAARWGDLAEAAARGTPPPNPGALVRFAGADREFAFFTPAGCAALLGEPSGPRADLAAYLRSQAPRGLEVLLVGEGPVLPGAVLRLGGHAVSGVPEAPPSGLFGERALAFRFPLSPLEAAAFLTNAPSLVLPGGVAVPIPAEAATEARSTFPEEVDVPLTLIEF